MVGERDGGRKGWREEIGRVGETEGTGRKERNNRRGPSLINILFKSGHKSYVALPLWQGHFCLLIMGL